MRHVLLAIALACVAPAHALAQSVPAAGATAAFGDSTFLLPAGWVAERRPQTMVLTAPERDLRFSIIDVGPSQSADDAVARASRIQDPTFSRKLRIATDEPAQSGWAEIRDYDYETSPNEQVDTFASAMRSGHGWTVVFAVGAKSTFNKRSGQINSFFQSLRPLGYQPETFAGRHPNRLDANRIRQLKAFLAEGMKELRIPGVGYAFIQDGRIIEEGGLGVREFAKPQAVDAHTRFMIASNTKGMTTLLLARLVDQGKLRWDEPVVEAYPAFKLGAADVTKAIQIRHLVCACTGMPRQDFEWHFTGRLDTPASRVFDMLQTMKPTSGFGEVYQYSNLLAASAGYVAARVAYPALEIGSGYDRAMRELIWKPLGMRDTTFAKAEAMAGDYAAPHADDLGGRVAVADHHMNDNVYFIRPAGGAWSSAHDVALYAVDELREGKLPGGSTLVSAKNLLERRFRGVAYGEGITYGMGLENIENHGVRMIHHGGSLTGYKSDWYVVPEAGVGVVVLTNADNGRPLVDTIGRRLLEVLYEGKLEAAAELSSRAKAIDAYEAKERSEISVPPDPAAVARLANHYKSTAVGRIAVRRDDGGLLFDFGAFSSHVGTRANHDGTISFVMTDAGLVSFELIAKPGGRHDDLIMRQAQHEYLYTPSEVD